MYDQGFARVAACTVPVTIADPASNAAVILEQVRGCHREGVAVAAFPELGLTGYAIDDLVLQDVVLAAVDRAVADIAAATADLLPLVIVGAPLRHGLRVFNCAVVIHRGAVLGVVPKSYLPTYREFYDKRYFGSGQSLAGEITVAGSTVPFGEMVTYYKNVTKDKGTLVFEVPPTHVFEIAKFREETMAFPPTVTIKDYTFSGSAGYPNPKAGAQPERFPTLIQIVPPPAGTAK